MQFDRPVPGQSLTTTPKAAPYERPPETADPMEAIGKHLDNLTKEGVMEDLVFFIEQGLDIQTLTEGILRSAVMEGIHSVDVSLIIGPVIFEFIRGIAIDADIEFDDGLDNPDAKRAIMVQRDSVRARKILNDLDLGEDLPDSLSLEDTEMPEIDESAIEEEPEEVPEESEQPRGLMARRIA